VVLLLWILQLLKCSFNNGTNEDINQKQS